ncbi:g5064 [Coccomyxa elongata]
MDFERNRTRSLSGRTKREVSRDELVSQVKAERLARSEQRLRSKSASLIQRTFWGYISRRQVRQELSAQWLKDFASVAASATKTLPATLIQEKVLPPILFACLPPFSRRREAALSSGAPVRLHHATEASAVRGMLALLLRSVAATEADLNYVSLATDQTHRQSWHRQCRTLVLLCAGVLGAGDAGRRDALLELAAARLLALLLDSSSWACYPKGDTRAANAALELRAYVSSTPALATAVRRLIMRRHTDHVGINGALKEKLGPAEDKQLAAAVQMATAALLRTLPQGQDSAAAGKPEAARSRKLPEASTSAAAPHARPELPGAPAAALNIAAYLLTTPRLLDGMPAVVRVQLTSLMALPAIMSALGELSSTPGKPESGGAGAGEDCSWAPDASRYAGATISSWPGDCLDWGDYLWALANLTGLVSGELVTKRLEGGRSVQYLLKPTLVGDPPQTVAYLQVALGLLSRAVTMRRSGPGITSTTPAQGAIAALWPLAEGTFVTQLLAALPEDQLPLLVHLYHLLLSALPALAPATGSRADKEEQRFVNALAMGTSLLLRLWRWLAMGLGLPLEAPMEATRGWDIASLQMGLYGVAPSHAALFGLFCRVYAQALLVLDDDDFYRLQSVFNLGQQRGIATSLNTLVYSTHCPAKIAQAATQNASPYPGFDAAGARAMLAAWAPRLLRQMYERDVRRAYCPPALWLGPFSAAEAAAADAASAEDRFSAAAVMRALLQGPPFSPGQPKEGLVGGRPAALAALLTEAPQCVPFDHRVQIFRSLVAADKERGKWEASPAAGGPRPLEITVRRGAILDDGFAALRDAGSAIKGRLCVSFVSMHGELEPGLDYGGLVKEFLEEVVKAGFDVNRGLFTATAEGGLAFPQPAAAHIASAPALLHFLGLAFGKALYEGILLDTPLAPFFVGRLQGRRPLFDELAALDPDLHRNLLHLKRYEGEAEDLCLSFVVEEEAFGRRTEHELLPGGADVAVTNANKLLYVHLVADWHLNGRLGDAAAAFAAGLAQVIAPRWLRLFNAREVNQLLAGGEGGGLDVADMRAHARYSGGYRPDSPTVKLFWKVVEEMNRKERSALMKFATSVSRAPLGGFKHLIPPLTLHRVPCEASPLAVLGGADVDRLPTASTCYNMLKLPNYRRASTLRKKLIYAINANAGFDLS